MDIILATESIRVPLTGVGRYTQELARQLAGLPEIASLRFLHGGRLCNALPAPRPGASALPWLADKLSRIEPAADGLRRLSAIAKARALRGAGAALFHGCNYYLPAFDGPCIATFHDVSVYRWPGCHRADRVRYMRREMSRSLDRAQLIITVSEFSRREIAAQFEWPLERIRAIPLACHDAFRPHTSEELAHPLRALGLHPDGYCLFVGTVEPRKNLNTLLDAYSLLPDSLRRRWPLVVAGHAGWNSHTVHERMRRAEQAGWLRYLGYVEEMRLPALLSGARLFAFPSLYEGFGLPVLEAMASGTPVLCSDASALPEVTGDAASRFSPLDAQALKDLIVRGLEDAPWRDLMRAAGRERASHFSWRRCAELTADAYRDALST